VDVVNEAVEAIGEDPTALGEVTVAEAWRQTRRSGRARCGPGGDR
jgi:hypothetical protein